MQRLSSHLALTSIGALILWSVAGVAHTAPATPSAQTPCDTECLQLREVADSVVKQLRVGVVKYALEIRRGTHIEHREFGPKRTIWTPPPSRFNVHDRFNTASVSKTITAVTLLQRLEAQGRSIDESIARNLPTNWAIARGIQAITFADLLAHRSGLRDAQTAVQGRAGYTYDHVAAAVAAGPAPKDRMACKTSKTMPDGAPCYQNINYALARELVAMLDGVDAPRKPGAASSARFVTTVNQVVFSPIGVSPVRYAPDPLVPTRFFPYPAGQAKGTTYGDWSLRPGSAGAHVSINELVSFTHALFSGALLPREQLAQMKARQLGISPYLSLPDGTGCWGKAGYFPGSRNNGAQLSNVIVGCDNGLRAALVINGKMSAKTVVLKAVRKHFK